MGSVIFIGAGNVAWHLASALAEQGIIISHIWSNQLKNAQTLCDFIENIYNTSIPKNKHSLIALSGIHQLDFSKEDASLIIVSVSDAAYLNILPHLIPSPTSLLVHTSGSHPMNILKDYSEHIGVFYPLQTFSKNKEVSLKETLFLIEANSEYHQQTLITLAQRLSENVRLASSEDRAVLHLAAVFACNFANHLWALSEQILKEKEFSFQVLKPLLEETMEKAFAINPSRAQTGPAIRNDENILTKHKNVLQVYPDSYVEIYQLMSKSIQENTFS